MKQKATGQTANIRKWKTGGRGKAEGEANCKLYFLEIPDGAPHSNMAHTFQPLYFSKSPLLQFQLDLFIN